MLPSLEPYKDWMNRKNAGHCMHTGAFEQGGSRMRVGGIKHAQQSRFGEIRNEFGRPRGLRRFDVTAPEGKCSKTQASGRSYPLMKPCAAEAHLIKAICLPYASGEGMRCTLAHQAAGLRPTRAHKCGASRHLYHNPITSWKIFLPIPSRARFLRG